MKKLTISLAFLLVCALTLPAAAQTILSMTTLTAAAYKGVRGVNITLNSTSGVVAGTDLYVDQELLSVTNVPSSGTTVSVVRGYGGTQAAFHPNSSTVFIIAAAAQPYALVTSDPQGACARGGASLSGGSYTAASTLYLPIINQRSGRI